jgi:glycosyltransferase involved in cell wall biosynthesis
VQEVLRLLYVYPQFHTVSFTLIARKHVEYLKKQELADVYELDELTFPSYVPHIKYDTILHPWIYIYHRFMQTKLNTLDVSLRDRLSKYLEWWRSCFNQLVAIDVCDSDRMSDYAVSLLNQADKVIVPSNYCVEVYRSSGVKRPVYRVPHGVDPDWYSTPNTWEALPLVLSVKRVSPALVDLYVYKARKNKRFLLFWLWHSEARKGWFEVREFYSRLVRERGDVVLVLKTMYPHSPAFQEVMHLGAIQVYGWLSEYEKMALYDLADVTLVFSRGGGFEHNALESLARGVPVVTSNRGSWTDYVPQFLQVKAGERVRVFEGNVIHVGYGYRVDVESALDKINDILDNYEDYKAKVREWRDKVLVNEFRWDLIANKLASLVLS